MTRINLLHGSTIIHSFESNTFPSYYIHKNSCYGYNESDPHNYTRCARPYIQEAPPEHAEIQLHDTSGEHYDTLSQKVETEYLIYNNQVFKHNVANEYHCVNFHLIEVAGRTLAICILEKYIRYNACVYHRTHMQNSKGHYIYEPLPVIALNNCETTEI